MDVVEAGHGTRLIANRSMQDLEFLWCIAAIEREKENENAKLDILLGWMGSLLVGKIVPLTYMFDDNGGNKCQFGFQSLCLFTVALQQFAAVGRIGALRNDIPVFEFQISGTFLARNWSILEVLAALKQACHIFKNQ